MDVIVPKTISTSTLTRASAASYYNNAGLISYAANNVLRIGYNPLNLAAMPLPMLESTRTNNIDYTEDIHNSFTLNALNVGYHSAKAPDGTYTANRYVETTSNSDHYLSKTVSSATAPSSFSVYAKMAERSSIYIRVFSGGLVDQTTVFDLSAGTYSILNNGTPPGTASIEDVGGGWYRCIVNQQSSGGVCIIGIYNGSTAYSGDGISGVYLWGCQLESVGASSYIPSTQTYVSGGGSRYRTNSSGLLQATTNVARQEYTADNLALAPKLLIEPSVTNLLTNPVNINSAPWLPSTTGTLAGGIDPTTLNNTGVTCSSTGGTGVLSKISQTRAVADDSVMRVFSVFVAKTAVDRYPGISLEYNGGSQISGAISINTRTGATNSSSLFNAATYVGVRSYPNFWRISVGVPNNSSGNTTVVASLYPSVNSNGSATWGGTNQSAIFWCAQLEVGFAATSPNTAASPTVAAADVTTSTSSTRQADVSTFGLIYTNIPENELPLYSPATTYNVDVAGSNSVIYNHVRYASLQASNTGHQPDISPTWWSVLGATNAYSMIDSQVGTQTVGTVGGHITAYVQYGALSSLNFINVNADTITVTIYSGYRQVYTTVIDMSGGSTGVPVTDYSLTNLPVYADAYVVVDVYAASTAPAIGNLVVGTKYYVGSTETSPTIGIVDYSIKNIDGFGNPTLTKRGYAKRMNTKQLLDDSTVDTVARLMASIRATPCVWNANTTMVAPNSNSKTSLIVYGYYKDWEIDVAYNKLSYMTCTIEGLL